MPLHAGGRACVNCGDPFAGAGDLCSECTPDEPRSPRLAGAACPHCHCAISWETIRRYRRSVAKGAIEVLYYCPGCRGVLEAACWMQMNG